MNPGKGLAVVFATFAGYDAWRKRNGWYTRFYPDGSGEVLYGAECRP